MSAQNGSSTAPAVRTTSAPVTDATAEEKASVQIGIIGMGDMGRLYADKFSAGGWQHINVCDLPQNYDKLAQELGGKPGIKAMKNGHLVSRVSDFVIYSVEAAYVNAAVATYGPCE